LALRQCCRQIGRIGDVDAGARQQFAQQVGIVLAGLDAARRDVLGHGWPIIAFDYQQAGGGHCASLGGPG
jgi:hypothetical protein